VHLQLINKAYSSFTGSKAAQKVSASTLLSDRHFWAPLPLGHPTLQSWETCQPAVSLVMS